MIKEIYYKNSKGDVIDLYNYPYMMLKSTDLFDVEYNYSTSNNQLRSIMKKIKNPTINVVIKGMNKSSIVDNMNMFFETVNYDVIHGAFGRLYVNGYYLECCIVNDKKDEKFSVGNYAQVKLSIVTKNNKGWIKEEKYIFSGQIAKYRGKKYPHGYSYTYGLTGANSGDLAILDDGVSMPVIKIAERCGSPVVTIGDVLYSVDVTIDEGETLYIDAYNRKIYKVDEDGKAYNLYGSKVNNEMLYATFDKGTYDVYWNGAFDFEITMITERGEPAWM